MTKLNTPILSGLMKLKDKDKIRFHMPGHKAHANELYKPIIDNLLQLDFTEIDGADNLYNTNGIIEESLKLLTKERGSKKSFYLTNGTTVGILAGIMALTNHKDKVLLARNCHKSVYNAIELNELVPIILEHEKTDTGLEIPIAEEEFLKVLKKDRDIKMVILSRPNYFGLSRDIKELAKYCTENDVYLFVDEAHGSHLKYHEDLTINAMELGASLSVNSFHKTLPSLTQTSVINFGHHMSDEDIAKVLSMLEKLQTSSPSYIFMMSLELASAYMAEHGEERFEKLKSYVDDFYKSIEDLDFVFYPNFSKDLEQDFSRVILQTTSPSIYLRHHLEHHGIFIEMITKNIMVLITSPMDREEDFKALSKAIRSFNMNDYKDFITHEDIDSVSENNRVSLRNAEGRKLKENIIIYPPGNIYLKKGDVIKGEDISYLMDLFENGVKVFTDFSKNLNNLYVE